MEFGNKGMLAGLGLSMPEKVEQVREADTEARRRAGGGLGSLLDPGIGPILEEGATPFNVGMLALGIGPGFGAASRGTRALLKDLGVNDTIRNAFNKIKVEDYTDELLEAGMPSTLGFRRLQASIDELDPDVLVAVQNKANKGDKDSLEFMELYKARNKKKLDDPWGEEKSKLGTLDATIEGPRMKVDMSALNPALRNTSVGTHMYMRMLGKALDDPTIRRFSSDVVVSKEAQRVWESLARRGFNVRVAEGVMRKSDNGALVHPSISREVFYIDRSKLTNKNAYKELQEQLSNIKDKPKVHKFTPSYLRN